MMIFEETTRMNMALNPQPERGIGFAGQTVTDKLEAEKHRLEERLKDVNAAIEQLQSNPSVQLAVDALARLGHL